MLKHEAGQPETELLFSYGWRHRDRQQAVIVSVYYP